MIEKVYVIVAIDDGKVKECVVTEDNELAHVLFKLLGEIYGRADVALCCREVNSIPFILVKALAKRACSMMFQNRS